MSEFVGGEEKIINANDQIIFENKTDSIFEVSTGIIFHESGLYDISISGNRVTVTKVANGADVVKRKKGKWIYLFDKNGKSEWGCLRCSHIVYTDNKTERPEDRGIYYCSHCCSDNREENDNEMV